MFILWENNVSHDGISAVDWALSRISDPETGLPRGWISDLEVFAQKSRDRITKSRDQVIIWISDLVTGYALTTSYLGHCSKKISKISSKKSWGMPSLRIRLCNQLLWQESTLYNYYICKYSTVIPNASSKKVYGRQILVLFLRLVKSAPFVRE